MQRGSEDIRAHAQAERISARGDRAAQRALKGMSRNSNKKESVMTYRKLTVCFAAMVALAVAGSAGAQAPSVVRVSAPAQPDSISLMPDAGPAPRPEIWVKFGGKDYAIRNVTRSTITPFLPKAGTANGSAVIVAPGGAFMILAIEHEGWKVARALADLRNHRLRAQVSAR
jgi:hypothetical protein